MIDRIETFIEEALTARLSKLSHKELSSVVAVLVELFGKHHGPFELTPSIDTDAFELARQLGLFTELLEHNSKERIEFEVTKRGAKLAIALMDMAHDYPMINEESDDADKKLMATVVSLLVSLWAKHTYTHFANPLSQDHIAFSVGLSLGLYVKLSTTGGSNTAGLAPLFKVTSLGSKVVYLTLNAIQEGTENDAENKIN